MVTAGVYLIARMYVLFEQAPTAADISAFIGLATLVFAATCALAVTDLKRIIAYSTISQIGYMVVGVSIGAYAAGMFQLMTHAFFKALLFMAAGSVISAMAGTQDIDRMGGLRKAMPLTSRLMIIGALALAAFPGFSGFFSKDEILAYALHRGGFYVIFTVVGYFAALLTAFYAFRIIFRVFWGEPVPEARELEQGHLAHAPPENPMSGEEEDTDIGFPGAEHHIAEREWPMWLAMSILGFLSITGGFIEIPGLDELVKNFLAGAFLQSNLYDALPSVAADWQGLAIGGAIAITGIALAYLVYVRRPGTSAALIRRFSPVHTFLFNKWYFDELYDAVIYRPLVATGRFANNVVERVVVQGIVAAAVDLVRGVGVVVRGAQSGFVRAYALLLIGGFAALGLYFLIASQ
jgi:NADH-quinone oxidoreductase subunit L